MLMLLTMGLLAAAQPTVEVQTLAGEPVTGVLAELDAKHVALQTARGRVTQAVEDLAVLSVHGRSVDPSGSASIGVELIDGSCLVGTEWSVQGGGGRLALSGGKTLELPIQHVNWVRLQTQTETAAAEWSRIVDTTPDSDLLVTLKGGAIDSHKGILRDVSETTVRFEVDGEVLPVKRANVLGLIYFHPRGPALPESVCRLTDTTGSTWAARTVILTGGNLEWTTPAGIAVKRSLNDLVRIDYSQGKIVYLSSLKPETTTWTPFFGITKEVPALKEFFGPRVDRGLTPGPIALDKKPRSKGIALHSRTELVYRLPGKFRRFKALVGIDDRVQPYGNVRLVVRGDDRVLWEGSVTGGEAAMPLDLDVTGVRRLAILVDYGENLDTADHLDLAEARIVK